MKIEIRMIGRNIFPTGKDIAFFLEPTASAIIKKLNFNSSLKPFDSYSLCRADSFLVSIKISQNPVYRFSRQAKLEFDWVENLKISFENDFSWMKLRELYEGNN